MPMVGAAASAQHIDLREAAEQLGILLAELLRMTRIELGGIVELGMALARGVGPDPAHALHPAGILVQDLSEVIGVRAVDHVIGRRPTRRAIDRLDRVAQAFAGR